MRRLALAALLLSALAACGADGRPEKPGAPPGLSVTGEASIGITG